MCDERGVYREECAKFRDGGVLVTRKTTIDGVEAAKAKWFH